MQKKLAPVQHKWDFVEQNQHHQSISCQKLPWSELISFLWVVLTKFVAAAAKIRSIFEHFDCEFFLCLTDF